MVQPLSSQLPAALPLPEAPAPSGRAAQLPEEVVGLIVSKLDLEGRLTAGKICRAWRLSARRPGLWRQDLAALPQSPAALSAGMTLLAGLSDPNVQPGMPGGCIVGRNQRDLQQPSGYPLVVAPPLPRPPHGGLIGVSLDGFPYTFGPEQRLTPLPTPPSFTLPLPSWPPSPPTPYRPLPNEVDLTPLVIERQLLRQWRRFDGAVRTIVPRLEAMVQKTLEHNQHAVAVMYVHAAGKRVDLERYWPHQAPHEGPSLGAELRACHRQLHSLEVTARFLDNFGSYPPQERWHVYLPRWLMVALSHGWLDPRRRTASARDAAVAAAAPAPLFHYVGAGPPPSRRGAPSNGP